MTFTATPASGHAFAGWSGACTGTSTCQLFIDGEQSVTATFAGPPTLTYYHTDLLGSVRAITDASGGTVIRHDYRAFGESTSVLTGDPRRFLGQELDAETAFDHLGARQYRNVWGRFTSVDPIVSAGAMTNPQLWNRYAYALNGPLRFSDPSGMEPDDPGSPDKSDPPPDVTDVWYVTDDFLAQLSFNQLLQPPAPSSQIGVLTLREVAAIIYNETRSLSGQVPGLESMWINLANAILNADAMWGPDRMKNAKTASAKLSARDAKSVLFRAITLAVQAAIFDRGRGIDPTHGALHFNLRGTDSRTDFTPRGSRPIGPLLTQDGPFSNSYPGGGLPASGVYVNTYGHYWYR